MIARMWIVTKEFEFEAAHSLPHLPEGHKCRNLHGHGYKLIVEVSGETDERGFVIDYAEISEAVSPIVTKLDHRNLNEVFPFPTTSENVAKWLFEEIRKSIPGISRVVLKETSGTSAAYMQRA